jgi:uncharacterized protein
MKADIRERLRRLGVHKGAGHLTSAPPRHHDAPIVERDQPADSTASSVQPLASPPSLSVAPSSDPLWNLELETDFGLAFVRRTIYPLDHRHGGWALAQALDPAPHLLARLGAGAPVDLRDAIFLDTETTGLAGGAGTLVFLVGVGYFEGDDGRPATDDGAGSSSVVRRPSSFVVDQYFLREPVEEAGMLCALDQFCSGHGALVTFNGRGFDVPLLETRFTLSRMPAPFGEHAHLDLLMPSRRAWRLDLSSCSLGSLEYHLLDVHRDQHDIPGFLIPQLYREYLATGNPADMQRVMYHNLHDILSMVSLVSRLCDAASAPRNPGEYLAAGQYYEAAGQLKEAEETYRAALGTSVPGTVGPAQRRILQRLANCLKRQGRNAEAVPFWRALGEAGDLEALVDLAKHYEWDEPDLAQALACARQALALSRDPLMRGEMDHRIARLVRKQNSSPARPRKSNAV